MAMLDATSSRPKTSPLAKLETMHIMHSPDDVPQHEHSREAEGHERTRGGERRARPQTPWPDVQPEPSAAPNPTGRLPAPRRLNGR